MAFYEDKRAHDGGALAPFKRTLSAAVIANPNAKLFIATATIELAWFRDVK